MKGKSVGLLVLILVLVFALTGCFGGGSDSSSNSSSGSDSSSSGSGSDSAPPVGEAPAQDAAGEAVPEDIPVIPGAYDLDVIRSGTQVNFRVDGDIEYVMGWFQGELEAYGWAPTRAPDSAMGAIGTMSRANEAGDTVSINMSYNANGGFVIVQIAISRK